MLVRRAAFNSGKHFHAWRLVIGMGVALSVALTGCATNSPLQEPAFIASLQHKVTDLFDNPNPCSNNAL